MWFEWVGVYLIVLDVCKEFLFKDFLFKDFLFKEFWCYFVVGISIVLWVMLCGGCDDVDGIE